MSEKSKEHDKKVELLQTQVATFFARGKKVKIYHGSTNSTRPPQFIEDALIDVSRLNNVIEINTKEQFVLVEPNVPMDVLVDATTRQGLIPPVVTEFPGITIGGAIMGAAGESSSFRYGCVHEACLEYEVVLGDGRKLTVSTGQNGDLFHDIPCSYGSLGILTLVKLQLIPAKPYVHLQYTKVTSFKAATKLMQVKTKTGVDFIDGAMFSKTEGVVMVGTLSTRLALPVSTFRKPTDEWFSVNAQKVLRNVDSYEALIPLRDYLFRYDRGAFWAGKFGFNIFHAPFVRPLRILFAPLFKARTLFKFLHASNMSQQFLIQDACLPKENAASFMKFVDEHYAIYPLWLCPLKPQTNDFLSPTNIETDLVINVGIYGELKNKQANFIAQNQRLEDEVQNLKGRKVLYAHAYYSRNTFWDIYDSDKYTKLRRKYKAETVFPDVFEKTQSERRALKSSLCKGGLNLIAKQPFITKQR